MKAILKTDDVIFVIDKHDNLTAKRLSGYTKNINHLSNQPILYHYFDVQGSEYPVYFKHKNNFITKSHGVYLVFPILKDFKKTYTGVNLSILDEL